MRHMGGGHNSDRAGRTAAAHVRPAPDAGPLPHVQKRLQAARTQGEDQVDGRVPQLCQSGPNQEPQKEAARRSPPPAPLPRRLLALSVA